MGELTGKRAIITGGASGIGRATAEMFVEEGAQVVIADVTDEVGRELTEALGPSSAYVHTDVSNAAEVAAVVRYAVTQFGGLDIMFNNAGISDSMTKVDFIDDDFTAFGKVVAVNLLGPMLGMKYAALAMRAQGSGSIINTASIGGVYAGFGLPAYRSAKAGVIQLTKVGAIEFGSYGVRVNSISPGPIETPMAAAGFPAESVSMISAAAARMMTEMQILNRVGKPRDIANAALFLASDRSAQITGHNLIVDGGASVGDRIDRMRQMQEEFKRLLR
jgi:NAD(P)-dependent dehydrogenase (short-subunit alcohol dehydrogenase family)